MQRRQFLSSRAIHGDRPWSVARFAAAHLVPFHTIWNSYTLTLIGGTGIVSESTCCEYSRI